MAPLLCCPIPSATAANAQAGVFIVLLTLEGSGEEADGTPTIAEGGRLTLHLAVTNNTSLESYKISLKYGEGQTVTSEPLPPAALQCVVGLDPPSDCGNLTFSLKAGATQSIDIQFDTREFVKPPDKVRFPALTAGSSYTLLADAVDPQTGTALTSAATESTQRKRPFKVVAPRFPAQLKIQAPISLVVPSAAPLPQGTLPTVPQGSFPTLSFLVANTGQGAFTQPTSVFFSLVQNIVQPLPTTEFTLLIAKAEACEVDPNTLQVRKDTDGKDRCPLAFADRQITIASFSEGAILQLRITFFSNALDPGTYRLHGCLKRTTDTTKRSCDPATERLESNDKDPNLLDTLAVNFQVTAPAGAVFLTLAPESPTQIAQGSDVTALTFTLTNTTGALLRKVSFSFRRTPPDIGATDLSDCQEFHSNGSGTTKILENNQCVLQNVAPSGSRKFRVGLPTKQYTTRDKQVALLVSGDLLSSQGLRFPLEVEPKGGFVFPIVEKLDPRTTPTPAQGPELHPLSLEFVPTSPVTQRQVVLIRSRIENSGTRSSGPFTVAFQFFSVELGTGRISPVDGLGETRRFPGIDPGVVIEASTLFDTCAEKSGGTCQVKPGTYLVKVVVSTVPNELDPTNNEISTLLTIRERK
jgi:hypothetical protein